jgi:hypothetical protein
MDSQETRPFSRQGSPEPLEAVLLAYFKAVEAGQRPDESKLLADHPHLASELAAFFAGQKRLKRRVDELKAALP